MLELFLNTNVIWMKPLFKKKKSHRCLRSRCSTRGCFNAQQHTEQSSGGRTGQEPAATSNRTIGSLKSSVRIGSGPHASLSRWYRKIGSPLGECITTSCVQTCQNQKPENKIWVCVQRRDDLICASKSRQTVKSDGTKEDWGRSGFYPGPNSRSGSRLSHICTQQL